jgi:uncharacterized protein YggE
MLIFFLFALGYCQSYVPEYAAKTLSVQGSASDYVNTTEVVIGFAVETQEKNAVSSFDKNKNISSTVDDILDSINIPKENITTTGFNIEPQYDIITYENRTSKEIYKGVKVRNEYEVRLSDVDTTSTLIDRITRQDVNVISYINFEIPQNDTYKIRNRLLSKALKDGHGRAQSIANSLNIKLGKVESVSYQIEYIIPEHQRYAAYANVEESAAPAPTLYSKQNKQITANVNIVYYIIN